MCNFFNCESMTIGFVFVFLMKTAADKVFCVKCSSYNQENNDLYIRKIINYLYIPF